MHLKEKEERIWICVVEGRESPVAKQGWAVNSKVQNDFKLGCKGSKNVEGVKSGREWREISEKRVVCFLRDREERIGIDGNDWWGLSQIKED